MPASPARDRWASETPSVTIPKNDKVIKFRPRMEDEVSASYMATGGIGFREVINYPEVPLERLERMLKVDGQLSALYNLLTIPIITNARRITVNSGGDEGKAEADFVRNMFRNPPHMGGMKTSIGKIIKEMCTAYYLGYKIFEKTWRFDEETDKIIVDKIAARNFRGITVLVDEVGDFDGFKQQTTFQGRSINVIIPKEKAILYTVNNERNAHYGIPYLLPSYYHFEAKHKLYHIAHIAHQMNAVPFRIGRYPQGLADGKKKKFLSDLANVGFNVAMVIPSEYEVDQFPKNLRVVADYMPLINHHDIQASKSVLAHFIDIGVEGGSGSWALSKNDYDVFIMVMQNLLEAKAELLNNEIVPQLIDWNFGTKNYPRVSFHPFTDNQKELLKEVFFKVAVDDAPNVSKEFLYKIEAGLAREMDLSLKYNETEVDVSLDPEAYPRQKEVQPTQSTTGGRPGEGSSRNKPPTRSKSGVKQPPNQKP